MKTASCLDVVVSRDGDKFRCRVCETQGYDEEPGRREAIGRGDSMREAIDDARSRAASAGIECEYLNQALSVAEYARTSRAIAPAPLADTALEAELLAAAGEKWFDGREQSRWHELALYRAANRQYVMSATFRSYWQGEADRTHAIVCQSADGVRQWLHDYDPVPDHVDFPAGDHYADRQRGELKAALRTQYDACVREVLATQRIAQRIEPDPNELTSAAAQLAWSGRGRDALVRVLEWLEESGVSLDHHNKQAILDLIVAAFSDRPMESLDAMREALAAEDPRKR